MDKISWNPPGGECPCPAGWLMAGPEGCFCSLGRMKGRPLSLPGREELADVTLQPSRLGSDRGPTQGRTSVRRTH